MARPHRRLLLPVVLCSIACSLQAGPAADQDIREPIGPGQFYPGDRAVLTAAIEAMLKDALPPRPDTPIAIIVPHAGYVYSGQIAADAYRQVSGQHYDTIVILGTNHTDATFEGVGIYGGAAFRTPLGVVEVDRNLAAAVMKEDPRAVVNNTVHAKEHSIEVQVPFIQHLFPRAKILPIVIGEPDLAVCARFGRALARAVTGRSVLIVASSDLSHYPAADAARVADRKTLEAAASLQPAVFFRTITEHPRSGVPELLTGACGAGPILVAMNAASALGATRGVVLSYANSGDTALGDTQRAVGYGAVMYVAGQGGTDTAALSPPPPSTEPLQATDKKALLALARETIRRFLATQTTPLARGLGPRVERVQGAFVTLKKRGDLRGCIGQIVADRPLARIVSAMAYEAAFGDPRFDPLRANELSQVEIEISVLTPPKAIPGPDAIVVGRDGVILQKGGRSAVFLPQVATEQGWKRDELLNNLALKAGLPADAWRQGARFQTFQAEVFGEK
jgi:AmmeMemoRadiSam system protein B/AmmeMemoRadiSam system protein A